MAQAINYSITQAGSLFQLPLVTGLHKHGPATGVYRKIAGWNQQHIKQTTLLEEWYTHKCGVVEEQEEFKKNTKLLLLHTHNGAGTGKHNNKADMKLHYKRHTRWQRT